MTIDPLTTINSEIRNKSYGPFLKAWIDSLEFTFNLSSKRKSVRILPFEWLNPKTEIKFKSCIENQWKYWQKCERRSRKLCNTKISFELFFSFSESIVNLLLLSESTLSNKHRIEKVAKWFLIRYSAGSKLFFFVLLIHLRIWNGKVISPFNLWFMTEWIREKHCSIRLYCWR